MAIEFEPPADFQCYQRGGSKYGRKILTPPPVIFNSHCLRGLKYLSLYWNEKQYNIFLNEISILRLIFRRCLD